MGHKVYEISLNGHSYHFFALKNNFSLKSLVDPRIFFFKLDFNPIRTSVRIFFNFINIFDIITNVLNI